MDLNRKIILSNKVKQKAGLSVTDMDGETVMMDIDMGKYYGFNDVGSRIWEIISQPIVASEIITILLNEFNIGKDSCTSAVLLFLNRLIEDGIVEIEQ